MRSAVRKYAIKQKASITDEQSAFKSYVNALFISNIKLQGFKVLFYLKYQEDSLKQFLNENAGMKVLIQAGFKIMVGDKDGENNHVTKGDQVQK